MAVTINKLLTTKNLTVASRGKADINFIVEHYVGATGGAEANCIYFKNNYIGASAHYFIGHNGEIWQSVSDKDIAWHSGTSGTYYHPTCRNSNSIGIEMCCLKDSTGKWYFTEKTIATAAKLTKELMKKYDIPAGNVLRHYDVTRKICPAPYCGNDTNNKAWTAFKSRLTANTETTGSTSGTVNTSTANTVTVTGATSYLRSDGRVDAKTLKVVTIGTKLTWISDDGWGWSKVKSSNTIGWIQNSRLTGKSGLSTWRVATFIGTGVVNVRRSKSTANNNNIAATVQARGTFGIISIEGNWIRTNMTISGKKQDLFIYYDKSYISIGGKRTKK